MTTPRDDALTLLHDRGAHHIEHPGGTLHTHLVRVHDRLLALGLTEHVALAGLTHAAYGTDGFAHALLATTERDLLRATVGAEAEQLVHHYGGCARKPTWPHLTTTGLWHNRFDGSARRLPADTLRDLLDLTIVNELDVCEQSPDTAARHGEHLRDLFTTWTALASPRVSAEARRVLGG
ncbi:DUF6817 domain-containing protein [Catellatospora tritici]|uniref:DUF6817 domain-containing protein n=1 Tax=Catellatospora tritici TaxID=2851566 RepID=UPI001C2D8309|nr:hypothetical protein [Catellatospora tritici]MBV1850819.1 hypothetical protein [Catellatospora tritici]MBV1851072.1 hypothetical protein [Catellatospora tritici]